MGATHSSPIRLDGKAITLTAILVVVLLALACMPLWHSGATLLPTVACIAVLIALVLPAPRQAALMLTGLKIKKVAGSVFFPYADIDKAQLLPAPDLSWRVCASGGFMGYWGIFRNRALGHFHAYIGKPEDTILLTMSRDKRRHILFSCDDPVSFLDALNARMNQPSASGVEM